MTSLPPRWRGAEMRLSDLTEVLPDGTLDAWPEVAAALPETAALMGGTGLAVWLRHRRSEDLDFFVRDTFDSAAIVAKLAAAGDVVTNALIG